MHGNKIEYLLKPPHLPLDCLDIQSRFDHTARLCIFADNILGTQNLFYHVISNNPNIHRADIYHSTQHILYMTSLAYSFYVLESNTHIVSDCSDHFNKKLACLIVSCMFHDYGHSLGKEEDSENIKVARNAAVDFLTTFNVDPDLIQEVERSISITQYPFVYEPDNLHQQCMRDADVIYGMVSIPIILGLCAEMELPIDTLLFDKINFMANTKIFTKAGLRLVGSIYPKHLKDLLLYLHTEHIKHYGGDK